MGFKKYVITVYGAPDAEIDPDELFNDDVIHVSYDSDIVEFEHLPECVQEEVKENCPELAPAQPKKPKKKGSHGC